MPSITVTAPAGAAGGQDIAPGSTYAIRWTSVGVGNVLLNLCNYYGNCIPLSNIPSVGIAASLGSFNGYSGYFSAGAPAQTTASTSAPFSFSISPSLVAPAGIIGYHFFGGANVNYYTLYLTCSPLVGATDPALNDMCNTTTKISSQLAAGSDYGPYGGQVNNIGSSTATVAVTATAYDANGVSLGQQTASFQISGSTQ